MTSASRRRESGCIVLETPKLLLDAAGLGLRFTELWLTERALEAGEIDPQSFQSGGTAVYLMSDQVACKLSLQPSPQGVIGVAERPAQLPVEALGAMSRVLLLSGVQDPGNVGAAIRSAAAFGFEACLLDRDCADPYSPKALRASMGACFRLGIAVGEPELLVGGLRDAGFSVLAAALHRDSVPADRLPPPDKLAVAIGSEGRGLAPEVIDLCSRSVVIPLQAGVESLNAAAAAAVLMWIFRRR